jgi:hypothetical protein
MTELSTHLTFLSDPGHGWLRVPLVEIVALEIEGQISPYSFIQGQHAFLEEDCDCPRYLQARASRGFPPPVIEARFVERFIRPELRFQDSDLDPAFWERFRR